MSVDIQRAILQRLVSRREGWRSNDPVDRGGKTLWGQTSDFLDEFDLPEPKDVDDAIANYLVWLKKTGLDCVCDVNDDFADAVLDCAIHNGTYYGIRQLQLAVGVTADEVIGPKTRASVATCDRVTGARTVWAGHGDRAFASILTDPALHPLVASTQLKFLIGYWNRLRDQAVNWRRPT